MTRILKKCEKHNSFDKDKQGRCLQCGREKARNWNRLNKEHCKQKNRIYHRDKKEKIAKRKAELYKENPEKYKLSARNTALKMKYNLTLDEYNVMLESQNGVCKICLKPETQRSNKNGKIDSLRVDHCHATNKVRGLLCSKCNFGIGQFNDNIDLLKSATKYLHEYDKLTKNK